MTDEPAPDDVYLATSIEELERRAEALAERGDRAALLELIATVRRHAAAMREHVRDVGWDELDARVQALTDRADALERRERELREAEEALAQEVTSGAPEAVLAHAGELEPAPVEPEATHLLFVPGADGYALVEREGPTPAAGETVDLGDRELVVAKVAGSPLPGDPRPCAYLV